MVYLPASAASRPRFVYDLNRETRRNQRREFLLDLRPDQEGGAGPQQHGRRRPTFRGGDRCRAGLQGRPVTTLFLAPQPDLRLRPCQGRLGFLFL